MLPHGTMLGAYAIGRQIGQGGFAAVFEARHVALNKRVAIKTLLPHYASNPEVRTRFLREAEAAAKLEHPNVVDVTHVGHEGDRAFMVMEFLVGEDLGHALERRGRLSQTETADVLVPVLSAVAVAHDAGIIHRDLKSDNIYLCDDGRGRIVPKVLDFGISKLVGNDADDHSLTGTGTLLGTPYYMSPEQAQGARHVDPRSDQFSLGVILYESISGRLPFQGDSLFSLLGAIVAAEPPSLDDVDPRIDPDFIAIIRRALAKQPSERFLSARAMGRELCRFASPRVKMNYESDFELNGGIEPAEAASPRHEPSPRLAASPDLTMSATRLKAITRPRAPRIVAATAAVCVLGGVVAAWLFGPGEPAAVSDAARVEPARVEPGASPPQESRPPIREQAAGPKRDAVRFAVRANPSTARLLIDEVVRGIGSIDLELPLDGTRHILTVSADGFEPSSIEFGPAPPPSVVQLLPTPARQDVSHSQKRAKPRAIALQPDRAIVSPPKQSPVSDRGANQALILR